MFCRIGIGNSKNILMALVIAAVSLAVLVAEPGVSALAYPAATGLYELSFSTTGPVPLTDNRLPVGQELVLKAHVEDISGVAAQRGEVVFQDCEMKGKPAPSAACDFGGGAWVHVFQMSVDASGNAAVNYGFVANPRTIGFRFRYIGQGSGIANGASKSADITWF